MGQSWPLALALLAMIPSGAVPDEPKSPDEQFRALKAESDAAYAAFVRASEEAKTEEDQAAVDRHPGRNPRGFAPGFLKLARAHPGTAAAEDSLVWVGSHVLYGPETEEAKALLVRDHVRGAKLGPAFAFQYFTIGSQATDRLLRGALAENPHRDVQGLACYWLARFLKEQAEWSRGIRRQGPDAKVEDPPILPEGWGRDYRDRLRRLDPDALDREADRLFERVAKQFSDVPHDEKRRDGRVIGPRRIDLVGEVADDRGIPTVRRDAPPALRRPRLAPQGRRVGYIGPGSSHHLLLSPLQSWRR